MDERLLANAKPHGTSRGLAAKTAVIVGAFVVTRLSIGGLNIFERSLWVVHAVFAVIEAVPAVALFTTRWRNIPAANAVAVLAIYQAGESYFNEIARFTSSDPVIPIEIFGNLILGAFIVVAIYKGRARPRDARTALSARR